MAGVSGGILVLIVLFMVIGIMPIVSATERDYIIGANDSSTRAESLSETFEVGDEITRTWTSNDTFNITVFDYNAVDDEGNIKIVFEKKGVTEASLKAHVTKGELCGVQIDNPHAYNITVHYHVRRTESSSGPGNMELWCLGGIFVTIFIVLAIGLELKRVGKIGPQPPAQYPPGHSQYQQPPHYPRQ